MNKPTLSEYVKNLHKQSGLSSNEFAKMHNMSHTQLATYESDLYNNGLMSVVVITRFCNRFDLTYDEFKEKIFVNNPALDDIIRYSSTTDNLIYSLDPKARKKKIIEFYNIKKDDYSFSDIKEPIQIKDDLCKLSIDKIILKNGEATIATCYFPYKKTSKESKVSNVYVHINDVISYINSTPQAMLTYNNFLFITPSYEAFNHFSKREYNHTTSNTNLIFLYYKYRRKIEYTTILGKDFLK